MVNNKRLLHYGLQRSGTNFLENLLLENFKIRILNSNLNRKHPLQKHFRHYDQKNIISTDLYKNNQYFNSFIEFENSLNLSVKIDGIVIISKDPYSWLISYNNWAEKCNWPIVNYHYLEEYNLFYNKWFEFSKQDNRIVFVKYVNLLSKRKEELLRIKHKLKLKSRLSIKRFFGVNNPVHFVPQSQNFTIKDANNYINKEYLKQYNNKSIDKVNSIIDSTLMYNLGYDKVHLQ